MHNEIVHISVYACFSSPSPSAFSSFNSRRRWLGRVQLDLLNEWLQSFLFLGFFLNIEGIILNIGIFGLCRQGLIELYGGVPAEPCGLLCYQRCCCSFDPLFPEPLFPERLFPWPVSLQYLHLAPLFGLHSASSTTNRPHSMATMAVIIFTNLKEKDG